jgi:hypothetical protein
VVWSALFAAPPAEGANVDAGTRTFPYRDREMLAQGQKDGALAYVPEALRRSTGTAVKSPARVVVFLHGINPKHELHPFVSPGPRDLRAYVEARIERGVFAPFVLLAPTQSVRADIPERMWEGFDLDDFLDAAKGSLGGDLSLGWDDVVLVGHSGAGCNPTGGLLRAYRTKAARRVRAVIAIDTCLGKEVQDALFPGITVPSTATTALVVHWQTWAWARPFDTFRRRLGDAKAKSPAGSIDGSEIGPYRVFDAHERVLPDGLDRTLPRFFPLP